MTQGDVGCEHPHYTAEKSMTDIITSPAPTCFDCGAPGFSIQENVNDPDGRIAGEWTFRQCSNKDCGLVWLDPAPLETELWKAYANYHTHTRDSSKGFEKPILSISNRLIKLALLPIWISNGLKNDMDYLRYMTLKDEPAGRLLDVGCGAGRLLNRMRKRGWEVEGTDFDPQATSRVSARYGIKTHTGDLAACTLPGESFDAITMSQTIEHLHNPRLTLEECMRVLKPGGLLIMTTPNVSSIAAAEFGPFWRGWEPPRHLHMFSVASLKQFSQRVGFEIIEARSYSADSAVVYRVSKLNQLKQGRNISFMDRLRLIGWGYKKELQEHLAQKNRSDTGQNILIRARKPPMTQHGALPDTGQ